LNAADPQSHSDQATTGHRRAVGCVGPAATSGSVGTRLGAASGLGAASACTDQVYRARPNPA
jgi:hypothetical protein